MGTSFIPWTGVRVRKLRRCESMGRSVSMPEPSPRRAPGEPSGQGFVVLRRRRADWGGEPRPETLSAATATLEADYALTAAHSDDVVSLSEAIADELGVTGRERAAVLAAAALHDIGKVAVPQEIVDKPGPLASHEWEGVRRHTLAGERIGRSGPELDEVAQLVRWSHERWDGLGYPDGSPATRSLSRAASSSVPTPTTPSAAIGPTAPAGRRSARWPRCARTPARNSTRRSWRRWTPPRAGCAP